jgi:hypothetical protein
VIEKELGCAAIAPRCTRLYVKGHFGLTLGQDREPHHVDCERIL